MFGLFRKKPAPPPPRPKLDYPRQVRRARELIVQQGPPWRIAFVVPDGSIRLVEWGLDAEQAEAAASWLEQLEPGGSVIHVGAIARIPVVESPQEYIASIPFLSSLASLAWGGHLVTVVAPDPDVLFGICQETDLLFVDGVQTVWFQQSLPAVAIGLMRRPRIFVHDGSESMVKLGRPGDVW